jgi:O-antigen ligase
VTAAAAAVTAAPSRDRLGVWCGWVMVGAAGLIPLLGWLAQLGFAPLLALMGLLCLPAFRIADRDRPVLIVLFAALIWASISATWSPTRPTTLERSGALQLSLSLLLFWSAVCGARRAEPALARLALRVLTIGVGFFGLMLFVESLTGARFYQTLHQTVSGPIRIDLAQAHIGHATFVLAILWPALIAGAVGRRWQVGLVVMALVAEALAAHVFGADAPLVAIPLSLAAMFVVWRWPTGGPRLMAGKVAAVSFVMPGIVWLVRAFAPYHQIEGDVQLSWAARLAYWSRTIDWIGDRPLRGWGLDASRSMGPGIVLHPHNGALQVWLELGLAGALAASAFWALSLSRLARPKPDLSMAGVAGSATAYILFAWVSYGAWQGWWLALGALIPVLAALLESSAMMSKST